MTASNAAGGPGGQNEQHPAYNPLFETFVRQDTPDEEQVAGLVAYSLYKLAKAEWTESSERGTADSAHHRSN